MNAAMLHGNTWKSMHACMSLGCSPYYNLICTQTASQATFMLHCMAKNPEAQEKLFTEIQSVLGDRTQPTPDDLTKMPYLKGCMLESIRYNRLQSG